MTIFSRIIKGEIPCYKIAENDRYFAFLDIRPVRPGHTLVIPKIEVDYLFDLEASTLSGLLEFAQPIAKAIDKATGCMRTGLVVEGLEVPHAHLHLIPIHAPGQHAALGTHVEQSAEQMSAMAAQIRSYL
jgi:histidine triad (HIT) family protein